MNEAYSMHRWLLLVAIALVVFSGIQGCVLVVADENVAHDIRVERDRSRLARDIQREIDADGLLQYSEIEVTGHGGDIQLAGSVDGLDALQRAVDIALSHPGIDDLELELDVSVN